MRNKNCYPAFLLGVLLVLFNGQSYGQERDSTIQHYLNKIKLRDADTARVYGIKLYEYTTDKPQFIETHLYSNNLLYDISDEKYDAPANRKYIQNIYNIVTSNRVPNNSDRLDGFRILGDHYFTGLYQINKALDFYNRGMAIADTSCTEDFNQSYLSALYTNLSTLYLDLNELNKARLLIEKTIELDIANQGLISEFLAIDYFYLAQTFQRVDPKKSLAIFLRAKRQFDLLKSSGKKVWEQWLIKDLYISTAQNYLALKNSDQALLEIDTAIGLLETDKDNRMWVHGKALETKASILYYRGAYQQALNQYRMAHRFMINEAVAVSYSPQIFLQISRCYLAMQQPFEAQKQLDLALTIIDQSGPPHQSRLEKIVIPRNLFEIYYEQAKVYTFQYQSTQNIDFLYKAQRTYQEALKIFEISKRTVRNQESRQAFMINNTDFFESAIDLNFQIWEQASDSTALHEIFILSEKSKNDFLNETLNKFNISLTGALPDSVLGIIKSLDVKISQTEKKFLQAQLSDEKILISNTRDELIKYRKDQQIQMEFIEQYYPPFYQLKYKSSIPAVAALQKKLAPDQGVISYYIGVDYLYVLLFDRWNFSVERIPMDFSFSEKINDFNRSITTSTGQSPAAKNELQVYHETSFLLYQKLIEPFVRKLPAHLTILTDNLLENLAFEALLTALPAPETPYSDYPFLLKEYTINYQYSAAAICQSTRHQKRYTQSLLAIAPSFTDTHSYAISQLRDFGQLNYNTEEVDKIKKIIGRGKILKNAEATEENFMKLAPDYQMIHLATHGKINEVYADYSYLAFQEIKDSIENELLYIKDIYGLQLNADLVVLSACETANGKFIKGEGIINLARGFTHAGASAVVPTLWKINDAATADLMENFYRELKNGQPKNVAMTRAKRQFLEDASAYSAHPFYWAAFVVIGDVSPVVLPASAGNFFPISAFWWGMGTILILFILGIRYFLRH